MVQQRSSAVYELVMSKWNNNEVKFRGGLTNDIHPIFDKANFAADLDYAVLEQPLKLASKLLQTPQVLHYLYATFFGPDEPTGLIDALGRPLSVNRSDRTVRTLSAYDVEGVNDGLMQMANSVKFEVADVVPGRNAHCVSIPSPNRGCTSRIVLSKRWYDALRQTSVHTNTTLEDRLAVATYLMHELGHAANAFATNVDAERFHEHCLVNECGFELEAHLFGAIPNFVPGGGHGKIIEWPSREMVQTYGLKVICRNQAALPAVSMTWILPRYYSVALFHDWFWVEMGIFLDFRALVPDVVAEGIWTAIWVEGTRHFAPRSLVQAFSSFEMEGSFLQPGLWPLARYEMPIRNLDWLSVAEAHLASRGVQKTGVGLQRGVGTRTSPLLLDPPVTSSHAGWKTGVDLGKGTGSRGDPVVFDSQ